MAHSVNRHSFALTHRVLANQLAGTFAGELLRELALYVYQYPRRKYPTLDEDAAGEFFLFVESKLPRLLARFRHSGKPFEHYLNSVLSWQLKSFLLRRRKGEIAWQMGVSSPQWCEGASGHSEPGDLEGKPDAGAPSPPTSDSGVAGVPTAPNARRLLFALLKAGDSLSPDAAKLTLSEIGCSLRWFDQLVRRLRTKRAKAYQRLARLRRRRNRAFAALALCEEAQRTEHLQSARRHLGDRITRLRATLRTAQEEMAKVRLAPTNREIGAALGIPKGTVDTGLFWLKRQSADRYPAGRAPHPGEQQPA